MANEKYYQDIKNFPLQFKHGLEIASGVQFPTNFEKVLVCGLGGSSLYAELLNDYLSSMRVPLQVSVSRGYTIPSYADEKTLIILASHSGNTEETLSSLEEAVQNSSPKLVLTSGGKLLEKANEHNIPVFLLPKGGQPRLATGYFIVALLAAISQIYPHVLRAEELTAMAQRISTYLNEDETREIATQMKGKVPVVYSTDTNASLARISKIKFNENSKTQAFWNFFPELNHNEMVGFTNMVMNPYFLIFSSSFAHERNLKRIQIFKELMEEKGLPVKIVELQGETVLEEILFGYFFVDHITYYLAGEYGIDPEPVDMVEEFKQMLG